MRRACAPSGQGGWSTARRRGVDVQDPGLAGAVRFVRRPDGIQILDRRSFGRFLGLDDGDRVADAKTIWLFRETLTRAGAVARLFDRFDAVLSERGYLAMGGQIVDATVVEARQPRLILGEKVTIKGGGVPEGWSQARRAQVDRDGRWTLKRGRVRARIEHVFAEQKRRLGLLIRTVGRVRAETKITLANLAYNMRRLRWLEGCSPPA